MNIFDRLLGRKAAQLTYDQVANLIDGNGGGIVAGVAVNEKTALQVSTVLACVKAIADGCATPSGTVQCSGMSSQPRMPAPVLAAGESGWRR